MSDDRLINRSLIIMVVWQHTVQFLIVIIFCLFLLLFRAQQFDNPVKSWHVHHVSYDDTLLVCNFHTVGLSKISGTYYQIVCIYLTKEWIFCVTYLAFVHNIVHFYIHSFITAKTKSQWTQNFHSTYRGQFILTADPSGTTLRENTKFRHTIFCRVPLFSCCRITHFMWTQNHYCTVITRKLNPQNCLSNLVGNPLNSWT